MTDDEAFIRRIVDSPGDDLPRLVYADWLDERGDPRGAYLRAEREAYHTGDTMRLRELAVGLDAVWVARVSLPPVGACIEHVELTHRGPSLSDTDITDAEERIGIAFPPDYRAFLLNYNGGWICRNQLFETPDGELLRTPHGEIVQWDDVGWKLYPVAEVNRFTIRPDDSLTDDGGLPPLTESVESWVSRFAVVGHDPDWIGGIFLGVSGVDRGHVRILDTSVELEVGVRYHAGRPPCATTFAEFLGYLPNYPPPVSVPASEATPS